MAALLTLTAAGCGVDTSGDVIGEPGVARAPTTATGPPVRSTDPRAQFVHAPSVLGLPVRAARLRIGAARFAVEPGQRYGVAGRSGSAVTFQPDEADERPVLSQSPAHPLPSRYGQVVALGTVPAAIPGRRPTLEVLPWRHVAYEDGVVVLSGIAWGGGCLELDHVQVGPPGGAVRSVQIWAQDQGVPVGAGCEPRPTTIRVPAGNDWDPATSVWNGPLEQPRRDVPAVRSAPYARITVQPDRQTVMVTYLRGACEALSRASVTVTGRVATVDLRIGAVPPPAGATRALCPSMRSAGTTVIHLSGPLPRRAEFVDASPGRPAAAPGT